MTRVGPEGSPEEDGGRKHRERHDEIQAEADCDARHHEREEHPPEGLRAGGAQHLAGLLQVGLMPDT